MRREAAIESRGYPGGDVMRQSQDVMERVGEQLDSDTVTERAVAVIVSSRGESKGKLTVSGVAKRIGVDRHELVREFEDTMGMSVGDYIVQDKIYQAATVLTEDFVVGIDELSRQLGFKNVSEFEAAFFAHFAIKPDRYREIMKIKRGKRINDL